MGHALRLMVGREQALEGVVKIDSLYVGGKPRRDLNFSPPSRARKGQPKPLKTPTLVAVQRPPHVRVGALSGEVRAAVIEDLSEPEADQVLTETVDPNAHLMSDEWKAFVFLDSAFRAHDTIHHKAREYARGPVHINSAEGFNDRTLLPGRVGHVQADIGTLCLGREGIHPLMKKPVSKAGNQSLDVAVLAASGCPPCLRIRVPFQA